MKECHIVQSERRNTAGVPQEFVVCYCGTTACAKNLIKDYPLPKDFPNELSREEEDRFYKKVFNKS